MKKPAFALFFAFLFSLQFAGLTYLYSLDGTGPDHLSVANNFTSPVGLAYHNGQLYVSDSSTRYLYVMSNSTVASRMGGSGFLDGPTKVTIDPTSGNAYIADYSAGKIRIALGSTQFQELGNPSDFTLPAAVTFDGTLIYALDAYMPKIMTMSTVNSVIKNATNFNGGGDLRLTNPQDILLHKNRFYVADTDGNRIAVFERNYTFLQSIGKGKGGITLSQPKGIAADGNLLYVADTKNNRIVIFSLDGYPIESYSGSGASALSQPSDLAVGDGKLYIADTGNRRVQVLSIDSSISGGNATVLAQITDANDSVNSLLSLIGTAQKVGISATTNSPQLLYSALLSYDTFHYSDASGQASDAKTAAQSESAALRQSIIVKVRMLDAAANSTMAPYVNSQLTPSLAIERASILSKTSQVESYLLLGNLPAAVDLVLTLQPLADSFALSASGKAASEQNAQTEAQRTYYINSINSLRENLLSISQNASAYNQTISPAPITTLLDSAAQSANAGRFTDANQSIILAQIQLDSLSSSLQLRISSYQSSQDAIASAYAQVGSLENERLLFYPNMQPSRTLLLEADRMLQSDPQKAALLANEALQSAQRESSNAKTMSYIAIAVGGIALIALLAAAGVSWYLLRKKHKGL